MSKPKRETALAANGRRRLLIVEDDRPIAAALAGALVKAGYEPRVVDTGEAALYVLANDGPYNQMLLDIGLPGIDGFEVLRRIRAAGSTIPVLVVTARDAADDRAFGLGLGADDYVLKPFYISEIVARVQALGRRSTSLPGQRLGNGPLVMDVEGHNVTINGELVEIPPHEWEILRLLLARVQKIVSKDVIATSVIKSADERLSDDAIDMYVSRLRAKLQPAGIHIRTVRGHGFMLLDCADPGRPASAR